MIAGLLSRSSSCFVVQWTVLNQHAYTESWGQKPTNPAHIRKLKFQNFNIHPMSCILSNYMHTNIVIMLVKSGFCIYAQSTQYVKERALAVPRICICESICLPLNNAIQSIYVLTERSTIDLSRGLRRHAQIARSSWVHIG